ncbi:MAG: hypothetical protein IKS99_05470 [Firmicutes bacterium]|nr:hypothetical protein [Bacillota bacterium]
MEFLKVNDQIILYYPEGFHVMDDAERSEMNFLEAGLSEVLSDPERHMLVTVGWKKSGGFASFMLNSKDLAKNMESKVSKAMAPAGYTLNGFMEKAVGGKTIEGFGYEYSAGGVDMYGESFALKTGKMLYYFHLYARKELLEDSLPVWEEMLNSAEWI